MRRICHGMLMILAVAHLTACGGTEPAPERNLDGGQTCGELTCAEGHVCVGADCPAASCLDVNCAIDEGCADGSCLPRACGTMTCNIDSVCFDNTCVVAACVGVVCPLTQTCVRGACVSRACSTGDCSQTQACFANACVAPDCAGVICPTGLTCTGGVCGATSCQNGIKDNAEADIDCGACPCNLCGNGKTCTVDGQCSSNSCLNGLCTAPPPGAFFLETATPADKRVTLAWNPSSDAVTYIVRYGSVSGDYPNTFTTTGTSPTVITGLVNGDVYYFRVTAVNPQGQRLSSNELSAKAGVCDAASDPNCGGG